MGYILVLVLGGLAVIGIFVAVIGAQKRPKGRTYPQNDVTFKQPAAEEATPAASDTARVDQVQKAQRRTPAD